MPMYFNVIILISIILLSIYLLIIDYKNKSIRMFFFHAGVITLIVCILNRFYNFLHFGSISKAGDDIKLYKLIVLFIVMILGMLSSYFFKRFSTPKNKRTKFEIGVFIAPIFISPLIFIPLLDVVNSQDSQKAIVMLYFIAFQNGFLWREYYESKKVSTIKEK